ncbi:unnamed protein product [Owenia fusiformis]|uniref:Glycine N-acyltransferase-like protein n=1 Tax=Owenia fusiformis TaxID=6347 RepID=A0A8J1UDZ2_OWEFU|nr:unnamed protein product [Owenia fusiformis]
MVMKLSKSQLAGALATLKKKTPQSLPMCGVIQAELIVGWDWYDFIVDKWPDLTCIAATPQEWLVKHKANNGGDVWMNIFSCSSDASTAAFIEQCGIKFKNALFFSAIQDNVLRCLRKMSSSLGSIRTSPCHIFGIDGSANMIKDVNFDGLMFDELRQSDVDYVNSTWTFGGSKQTKELISNYVEVFPSSCIRDKENNSIYAHMMVTRDLSMGMLHVAESKRRLGYGSIVINNLAAKVKAIGGMPFWFVVEDNLASLALSERNGKKLCDDIFSWARFEPNK